jgi:Domain of unknown function (DUF4290)
MAKVNYGFNSLTYNTEKGDLLFPEYGRNIQEMIHLAKDEKDLQKRQLMVEAIVSLMYQMNPQSKNVDDYKDKLWKHVFRVAEYSLGGVMPPNGIQPTEEDKVKKPEPIGYPPSGARFRHYGNNVHQLIKKALEMEDGYIKDGMVGTIGAYMKLAYRTWNKEHYVSDEIIKADLDALSNGMLELEEGRKIDRLAAANKRRKPEEINTRNGGGGDYRNNNNRNDNRYDRNSNNNRNDNRNDNRYDRNDRSDNRNGNDRNNGGGMRTGGGLRTNNNNGGGMNNNRNNNNNNRNNNNDNRGPRR